jgi:hypothetical protein
MPGLMGGWFTLWQLTCANVDTAACEENPMSGIAAVVPSEHQVPIEEHPSAERDGKKPPRRPIKSSREDDLVETEQHKLDVET